MNNLPLVTVVVCTYNASLYIEQTLKSITSQIVNFKVEVFISDDSSTDNTTDIINNFEFTLNASSNFKIRKRYRSYNVGASINGPTAIKDSNSPYISICDGDDYWIDPYKLQKQVDFLEKNNDFSACCSNVLVIDNNNKILPKYSQVIKNDTIYTFDDIIRRRYHIHTCTLMFKKVELENSDVIQSPNFICDIDLLLNITKSGSKIFLMNSLFAFYRVHNSNITKSNRLMLKVKINSISEFKTYKGYKVGFFKIYLNFFIHEILKLIPINHPFKRK